MTSPYRPDPPVTRLVCPNCCLLWETHHVEPKWHMKQVSDGSYVRVDDGFLIECPRSWGEELRDGRIAVRPPWPELLESLRNPRLDR